MSLTLDVINLNYWQDSLMELPSRRYDGPGRCRRRKQMWAGATVLGVGTGFAVESDCGGGLL